MFSLFEIALHSLVQLAGALAAVVLLSLVGGAMLTVGLRLRNLLWTWAVVPVLPVALVGLVWTWPAVVGLGVCAVACLFGMVWQSHDLIVGGDFGEAARARLKLFDAAKIACEGWMKAHEAGGLGRPPGARRRRASGAGGRPRQGSLDVGLAKVWAE